MGAQLRHKLRDSVPAVLARRGDWRVSPLHPDVQQCVGTREVCERRRGLWGLWDACKPGEMRAVQVWQIRVGSRVLIPHMVSVWAEMLRM